MKKKLLLVCIPALMLLGACAGAQPEADAADEFLEDTLLHEEVFSDVSSLFGKARRNALPEDVDTSVPAVGVQKADNGSTYSVRFIAATTLDAGALSDGKAVWTRAMYKDTGVQYKAATAKTSLVAYTTLRDGSGTEYTIDDFKAIYGSDYKSFVVYTMLNIPKTTYDNYYLNAYLTIDPGTESSKTSNVLATNIVGTKRVSFSTSYTGCFLRGKIDGVNNTYLRQDSPTKGDYPENNYASFSYDLKAGDNFLIVQNDTTNNEFRIWDSSCLTYSGNTEILKQFEDNGKGKIQVKADENHNYTLYLNKESQLWRSYADLSGAGFYVRGPAVGDSGWSDLSHEFTTSTGNVGQLLNVHLDEENFKLASSSWGDQWGYWGYKRNGWEGYDYHNSLDYGTIKNVKGGAKDNFVEGGDYNVHNIWCDAAGYYDIYIGTDGYIYIEVGVGGLD